MATKVEQIRALNDERRQYLLGGIAMITPCIAALGQAAVERIVKTTKTKKLSQNDTFSVLFGSSPHQCACARKPESGLRIASTLHPEREALRPYCARSIREC
jgi:hypothetical protein